ncbi:hypothetical protein [Oligella ureolytica]|uniref:hypothetical protein n=1 Tax=Oligella ureolytica TaxID=90244 RepID=UPI00037D1C80|nr:hypothetical protein [Oligella ureolytica]
MIRGARAVFSPRVSAFGALLYESVVTAELDALAPPEFAPYVLMMPPSPPIAAGAYEIAIELSFVSVEGPV